MEEEYYYCGKCGSEVHGNDNFCNGCGADLNEIVNEAKENIIDEEETVPETDLPGKSNTVVLKKYSDEISAELAKLVLSEEGIYAIISKDDAGGMAPNLQLGSRIRLLVLNKDLKKAKQVLNIEEEKKTFDCFNSDMFLGLRTAVYHVNNIDKGKDWYSLAFEINPYFNKPFYVGYDIGGFELGLVPNDDNIDVKNKGQVAYWGVSDIEAVFKHLLLIGAQRHENIKDVGDGILTASVVDPFGNILGLIQNPHFK